MTTSSADTPQSNPSGDHAGPLRLNPVTLSSATSEVDFQLHQSAVEWSLIEPIVISSEDDIRSRVNWRERLQPFHHQIQNLITFCRRLPVSIIADDVGLGKTISAGLILSELLIRRKVNRALVVCTRLIGPQWIEELENKFGIDGRFTTGNEAPRIFAGDSTVVATTYETLRAHLDHARTAGFEMLILDEAHKLRNLHGTANPPQTAQRIRQLLEQRVFKYVLMLTATPMQNRIFDLYSLVDCLAAAKGHKNPFGDPQTFSRRFAFGQQSRGWASTPNGIEFRSILRQYLVRTRREVARLHFPSRLVYLRRVEQTAMDREILQIVRDAVAAQRVSAGNTLRQLGMAMMSSPQALLHSLQTCATANVGLTSAIARIRKMLQLSPVPSKMHAVMQIIEELREQRPHDWRMVIFTSRIQTLETIVNQLHQQGIPAGVIRGQDPMRNQQAIRAYSASPPTVHVIVSTDAGAEGVNLQKGNVVVNYDLPWNPMTIEQRIGRVQRLGSEHAKVLIFSLAVADSPEDQVVGRLLTKLIEISESVGDIESILEASEQHDQRDFETQIAQMVQQSLRGVDIQQQSQQAEENILRARALLARQQEELNQRLGDLSELHGAGVRPPNLTKPLPQQPFRQFVIEALQYAGNTVTEAPQFGEEVLLVQYTGQREPVLVTFSRDLSRQLKHDLPGRQIQLYQPGQQVYERLLETWRNRAACKIYSVWKETEALTRALVQKYVTQIPGAEIAAAKIGGKQKHFSGSLKVLARASNGVDRYEKLIDVAVIPPDHTPLDAGSLKSAHLEGGEQSPAEDPYFAERILEVVKNDVDFASFQNFYHSRLLEELPGAGSEPHLRKKIIDDFTISREADIRSVDGFLYETCIVQLDLRIDGHAGYLLTLKMLPAAGQLLIEPDVWETCDSCGHDYPSDFLDACQYSGKRVLRHLLSVSDDTGRRALPEYMQICDYTGRTAVIDEFAESSLSGRRVIRSALRQSAISDRLYLDEELTTCRFSDVQIGRDEIEISEVSGKTVRADEIAICVISSKRGHFSEFVRCARTDKTVLPEHTGVSSVSSLRVMLSLLKASAKPPGRLGLESEFITCTESGQRLLTDEVKDCAACGLPVDREMLVACPESGCWLLPRLLVPCHSSGLMVWSGVTVECCVSEKRVLRRLSAASGLSGRFATAEYLLPCAATGVLLLPDERFISDISHQLFRNDHQVQSPLSGRLCHDSESVPCGFSDRRLLPDETVRSDFSGQLLLQGESAASQQSGRIGHITEFFTCPETQLQLLKDEGEQCTITLQLVSRTRLSICSVTGQKALERLLVRCEFTQRLGMPARSVISAESGRRLLDDQAVTSAESGRIGHESELIVCRASGTRLFRSEAIICELSHETCAPSACEVSAISGVRALSRYFGTCTYTHARLLLEELRTSEVTGRLFRSDEMATSQESGRTGHLSEIVRCDLTETNALLDETVQTVSGYRCVERLTAVCVISKVIELKCRLKCSEFTGRFCQSEFIRLSRASGRLFCKDEGDESKYSARIAHQSELVVCEQSRIRILPDESVTCAISGLDVLRRLCEKSGESGLWGLRKQMSKCSFTDAWILPSESLTSSLSGRKFRSSQAVISSLSQRTAHRSEAVTCAISGASLLLDEAERCAVSGLHCDKRLLHTCCASNVKVQEKYLFTSDFSNSRAVEEYTTVSSVSGRRMLESEARYSAISCSVAHSSELVPCEDTGRRILPDERTVCQISLWRVGKDLCATSAISGRMALKRLMKSCQLTQDPLFPDEIVQSDVSGKMFRADQKFVSEQTKRVGHLQETAVCRITGTVLLQDEAGTCAVSGIVCQAPLLVTCAVTGKTALPDHCLKSDFSGLSALASNTLLSAVSNRRMLSTESKRSETSGKVAHISETVTCAVSGLTLLFEETCMCSVTGKRAAAEKCRPSAVSGNVALITEMQACEVTKTLVLPGELLQSHVSGRWFRRDEVCISERTGTVGHTSEFIVCDFTGERLPKPEAMKSEISGKWMSRDAVRRSERSGRTAHESETQICDVSGRVLLLDELRTCQVSGRRVDQTLLARCPLSGLIALRAELVCCEKTNRLLLDSETVVTPVLRRRVGRDVLTLSDFSGRPALPEELRRCQVTGRRGLPDEGVTCADTAVWMDPRVAERCSKTNSFYRPGICIKSVTTSQLIHPSKAVRHGMTKELMHPADARRCSWHGSFFRKGETSQCARTKLHFESKLIDSDGVFGHFAALMRRECEVTIRADLAQELRALEPVRLKRLNALYVIAGSPRAKAFFCRGHIDSRFRLDLYFVGFVACFREDGLRIVSPMTRELSDGRWNNWEG